MRIHYLQHVPFEGPGYVADWAAARKYPLSATKFYERGYFLPRIQDFDWLIILGGPMNVDETRKYPWLTTEKRFIKSAVEAGKTVIGFCLGAQLIAKILGAEVFPGEHKELGWFPVELTAQAAGAGIFESLPPSFMAFHWHGDTFEPPPRTSLMAYSQACENQAFLYNRKTLGLQFHLEATPESVGRLVENCGEKIIPDKYIQEKEHIISAPDSFFSAINKTLEVIFDNLARQ